MNRKIKKEPVIGLALGGGGALGYAHIGVLQVLKENNIPVHLIAGTSMGALVGGFYAAGMEPYEMAEKAKKIRVSQILDINLNLSGLFSGKNADRKITTILKKDRKVEELAIPFAAVAADLVSGELVVIKEGSLIKAMRCSYSVPGVFTPVVSENQILVDGGVINNVPADVAKEMGADIVIAVDVIGKYFMYDKPKSIPHSLFLSFLLAQSEITKYKPVSHDVLIAPVLTKYRAHIFNKSTAEGCVAEGRIAASKMIKEIKSKISKFKKNSQ